VDTIEAVAFRVELQEIVQGTIPLAPTTRGRIEVVVSHEELAMLLVGLISVRRDIGRGTEARLTATKFGADRINTA